MLALTDMLRSHNAGRPVPDDRLTVRAWLPAWFDHRTDLRPETVKVWRQAIDHTLRRVGTLRVRRLTPTDVEDACAEMPPGIAVIARSVLVLALRDAERDGVVDRNVARLSRPRKTVHADVLVPDAAQARALVAASASHRLGALIVVALGTGLRVGELLGMTRECLDLDAGTARIDWQLSWVGGEPRLTRPKTSQSRRVVPLAPFVIAALRSHLARQAQERLAAGRNWQDADGLVFTRLDGRPVHHNVARYVLDGACERAGLPHVQFHSLRRAALQLATEGASQKAAQTLAGHRSIVTTDIYVHASDDLARAATAAIEEALG